MTFGGYMENILTEIERENNIREIFLSMFKEEGISQEDLENAIKKERISPKILIFAPQCQSSDTENYLFI